MKFINMISKFLAVFGFLAIVVTSGWADTTYNGSCGAAESVALPYSTSSGSASSSDRYDYYAFNVPSPGTVTITTSGAYRDLDGYLYNSDCSTLVAYDNSSSNNPSISYHVSSAQTLKFLLYYYPSYNSTTYSLAITFTADPAQATNDSYSVTKNTTLNSNLLSNDTGPSITLTSHTNPSHGTLSVASDGAFTYVPTTNYVGADSFTYGITDSNGNTDSASVSIDVHEPITETTGGRDFEERKQLNLFGDVRVIGNTVLCKLNALGACVEPTSTTDSNSQTNLQKAPISSSTLSIPTGATVEYARLYWQGRKPATSSYASWDATSIANAKKIQIKKDSSAAYTQLTADFIDLDSTRSTNYIRIYSASADASGVVNAGGVYDINTSAFYTETGETNSKSTSDGLGAYGAWVLVVVYQDSNETKARNITIFDGYKQVTSSTGDINVAVNGFLTPKSGTVESKTYVFAGEGDKYISGDHLRMAGATYNTTLIDLYGSNAFDSRIDVPATRSPNLINNNGIDIQKYDTGTTSGAKNIITTNETGAKFQFTSTQDTYFPSLIVFSTQLYLPQLCYDYAIKQDGHYLAVDRDSYPIAQLNSLVSSSKIDITVYLKNKEADIDAQGISIKSDVNDTIFDQTGHIYTSNVNGSILIDRGTPTTSDPLCAYDKNGDNTVSNTGCTNGHDIRKGNGSLGAQDYVYTKYSLQPKTISGVADINQSLGLSIKYYIVANGNKIEYPDYVLGGPNVPLCPPSTTYEPAWGQFNVVQGGVQTNNIYTQVSRKPFDVDVIFDSNITTGSNNAPTTDINTTVLVEMIDVGSFGDINASCANPDSNLSAPIVVPLSLTPSNYQVHVPTQSSDYYNFAVQNGAFRVWYFSDANGTLIQNWTATTTNNGKTITAINGLYNSTAFSQCSSDCSDPTSTTCFTCIRNNYAHPLCSRDNFSVRPEAYDLRVYDVNATLPAYNIATDSTNLKNTTKIDLTDKNHYTPYYSTLLSRINLAAGYNYRYDINATGHDGTNKVPGYTRYFNGGNEYNATLEWNPVTPKTGCNSTNNKDLIFYVANGIMQNVEDNLTQVGEYTLNIEDTTWTAVDWQNMSHHTVSNGFLNGTDCIANSSITTNASGAENGCIITTDHGSDGGGREYRDYNMTFHPYDFNLSNITVTRGLNYDVIPLDSNNSFVYMSNVNTPADENMSLHISGVLRAEGYGHNTLSNFVDNCFAQPVNINIARTPYSDTNLTYRYKYQDFNSTDTNPQVTSTDDINNTANPIGLVTSHFYKDMQGTINLRTYLNFDRNVSDPVNPQTITLSNYTVDCNVTANCTFDANLTTMTTRGNLATEANATNNDLNMTVQYYYGRTHAPRYRYSAYSGDAFISYEVYCDQNGNTALLPNGSMTPESVDSINWYQNTNHTVARDGNITAVTERRATIRVTQNSLTHTNPEDANISYDQTAGYPYQTTMQDTASGWLIYNKYNPAATANEFEVEFYNPASNWAGQHETNTTTDSNASDTTSKRIFW